MTDVAMLQFSLSEELLSLQGNDYKIEIGQALNFIQSHSMRRGILNTLAIENMIEVIEELLEQIKIDHKIQRIVLTSDVYMQQLSELFFNHAKEIDRIKLEHAFNEFVEHIEYYVQKVTADHVDVLVYFIFIREMTHHLNVVEIKIL